MPFSDRISDKTKGTYLFMAPEMFKTTQELAENGVRGRSTDIWAAGITLFNLLTKKFPFTGKNIIDLTQKMRNFEPNIDGMFDEDTEQDLKVLLQRMLEKNPDKRINIYEILEDPWVTDHGQNMVDLDLNDSSDSSTIIGGI